jgi:hypothetical protein
MCWCVHQHTNTSLFRRKKTLKRIKSWESRLGVDFLSSDLEKKKMLNDTLLAFLTHDVYGPEIPAQQRFLKPALLVL